MAPSKAVQQRRRRRRREVAARAVASGSPATRPEAARNPGRTPGLASGEPWPWRPLLAMIAVVALFQPMVGLVSFWFQHARSGNDLGEYLLSANPLFILASCFVAMPLSRQWLGPVRRMSIFETASVGALVVVFSFALYAPIFNTPVVQEFNSKGQVVAIHLSGPQYGLMGVADVIAYLLAAPAYRSLHRRFASIRSRLGSRRAGRRGTGE